jgi:hypothetical protein
MNDAANDNALLAAARDKFSSERSNLERLEGTTLKGVVKARAALIRRIAAGKLRRALNAKDRILLAEFVDFGAKAILSGGAQRGGDFLNNQLRGRWAEQVVLSMQLPETTIVAFGPSGAAMPGQEDYRRIVTTYGEIERLEGKRPDLIAFDRKVWDDLTAAERERAATWPERLLENDDLEIVSRARFGIEVKNSTWHFGTRRERHATLEDDEPGEEAPDVDAASEDTPPAGRLSITVKEEELQKIVGWMKQSKKPVLFFQVLFDEVYCMSFSRMVDAIRNGQLYAEGDYVARKERQSDKFVHFFYLANALHRCAMVRFPAESKARVVILASGSVIPYVELLPAEAYDAQATVIDAEVQIAESALRKGLPEITPTLF